MFTKIGIAFLCLFFAMANAMLTPFTPRHLIKSSTVENYIDLGFYNHKDLVGAALFDKSDISLEPTIAYYLRKNDKLIKGIVARNSTYNYFDFPNYYSQIPGNTQFISPVKLISDGVNRIWISDEGQKSIIGLVLNKETGILSQVENIKLEFSPSYIAFMDEGIAGSLIIVDPKSSALLKYSIDAGKIISHRRNFLYKYLKDVCSNTIQGRMESANPAVKKHLYALTSSTLMMIDGETLEPINSVDFKASAGLSSFKPHYIESFNGDKLIISDPVNNIVAIYSGNLNYDWSGGGVDGVAWNQPQRAVVYKHQIIIPQPASESAGWEAFMLDGFIAEDVKIESFSLNNVALLEGNSISGSFSVTGRAIVGISLILAGKENSFFERFVPGNGIIEFESGPVLGIDSDAEICIRASGPSGVLDEQCKSISISRQNKFVDVPSGSFRGVVIPSLAVGLFEVTTSDYWSLKNRWLPSTIPENGFDRGLAVEYLNALSARDGFDLVYKQRCVANSYEANSDAVRCIAGEWEADYSKNGYRLPTKEEWQYLFTSGNELNDKFWADGSLGEFAWYLDNSGGTSQSVGQKKPNGFGLYDIVGNLYEIVENSEPREMAPSYVPISFEYYSELYPTSYWDNILLKAMGGAYSTRGAYINSNLELNTAQFDRPELWGLRAVRTTDLPKPIIEDVTIKNSDDLKTNSELVISFLINTSARMAFWLESPFGYRFRLPIDLKTDFAAGRHTVVWGRLPSIAGRWNLVVHTQRSTPLPIKVPFTLKENLAASMVALSSPTDEFNPILMNTYEVSQMDYLSVVGRNPSKFSGLNDPDYLFRPVEHVTLWDALIYCNLRSLHEGFQPYYTNLRCLNWSPLKDRCLQVDQFLTNPSSTGYRLPSEEEWKFAYGVSAGYFWADGQAPDFAWYGGKVGKPQVTGKLKPNGKGVYDIAGNVYEWLSPSTNEDAVYPAKGGNFLSSLFYLRADYTNRLSPIIAADIGFRAVRNTLVKNVHSIQIDGCYEPSRPLCGGGWKKAGETVLIEVQQEWHGWTFSHWEILTGDLTVGNESVLSFAMPNEDIHLLAVYDSPYRLLVKGGTGTGNYNDGDVVSIVAYEAPSGMRFSHWSGDVEYLSNLGDRFSASVDFEMPALVNKMTLQANYTASLCSLTVFSGYGSGLYEPGQLVNISPFEKADSVFEYWVGSGITDSTEAKTTILIKNDSVQSVKAIYSKVYESDSYVLNVFNGVGSGTYPSRSVVDITAKSPPSGYEFYRWGCSQGDCHVFSDERSPTPRLFMPSYSLGVWPIYIPIQTKQDSFDLKVVHGNGTGKYRSGDLVFVEADPPNADLLFNRWVGSGLAYINDAFSAESFLLVPNANVELIATYSKRTDSTDDISEKLGVNSHLIWDFERRSDWFKQDKFRLTTSLSTGDSALKLNGPGWVELHSASFMTGELAVYSSQLAIDVAYPAGITSPYWLGTIQICFEAPNLATLLCGSVVDLKLNQGTFAKNIIPLTREQIELLSSMNTSIVTVIRLNSNDIMTIDNLRFYGVTTTNNARYHEYLCTGDGCNENSAIDLGVQHKITAAMLEGNKWFKITNFDHIVKPMKIGIEVRPVDGAELSGLIRINGSEQTLGGWYAHYSIPYNNETRVLIETEISGQRDVEIRWWGDGYSGESSTYTSVTSSDSVEIILQDYNAVCPALSITDLGVENEEGTYDIHGVRCFAITNMPNWTGEKSIFVGFTGVGKELKQTVSLQGALSSLSTWWDVVSWQISNESHLNIAVYSEHLATINIKWWAGNVDGSELNTVWEIAAAICPACVPKWFKLL